MSSKKTHLDQANHNEKAAKAMIDGDYYDWSCTCAFYSALHYVEARFADIPKIQHTDKVYEENKDKLKGEDVIKSVHWYREVLIGNEFPSIRSAYTHLQATSKICRYLTGNDKSACDVVSRDTAKRLVNEKLATIKEKLFWVGGLVGICNTPLYPLMDPIMVHNGERMGLTL